MTRTAKLKVGKGDIQSPLSAFQPVGGERAPIGTPKLWLRVNWLASDRQEMVRELLTIAMYLHCGEMGGIDKGRGEWSAVMKFKTKLKCGTV